MAITFTGVCTFEEKGNKNKVSIETINGVHFAKCKCGNKWESEGVPKTLCDRCNKDK